VRQRLSRNLDLDDEQHVTLCEALDRVLNKGAVVVGEVTISVANVDLIYLGLQLVVSSIETGRPLAADAVSPMSRLAEKLIPIRESARDCPD